MAERRARDPFETWFADRVQAYTDVATARQIDALAVSRAAVSSRRVTGWSKNRLDAGWLGRRIAGPRSAAAFVAIVFIGVVAITVAKPSLDFGVSQPTRAASAAPSLGVSNGGPIPDVLRHAWQRPYAVTPGLDRWGTGFLSLANGRLESKLALDAQASRSAIAGTGVDSVVVTATSETLGCRVGDVGAFRWSVEGKGTVLTLTAIGADACAGREEALAGPWVRADLPVGGGGEVTLPPGTHETSGFDPFVDSALSGQLSYTVPAGWKVKEDQPTTFVLHHLSAPSQSQPAGDLFIFLFAQPAMSADVVDGATCGRPKDAPGVGRGVDELVAAITARRGVDATPPVALTIGGYGGQMLDLHLATSWTGGCLAPEGRVVGMSILHVTGSEAGPAAAIGPDQPLRLILVDLGDERTMAIVVVVLGDAGSAQFEDRVVAAMPIIESLEFHLTKP